MRQVKGQEQLGIKGQKVQGQNQEDEKCLLLLSLFLIILSEMENIHSIHALETFLGKTRVALYRVRQRIGYEPINPA